MNIVKLIAVFLLCVCFKAQSENWYFTARVGLASTNTPSIDVSSAIDDVTIEADDTDTAFEVAFGYRFSESISLFIGYLDMGEGSLSVSGNTLEASEYIENTRFQTPVLGAGVSAIANYSVWRNDSFFANLNLGLIYMDLDIVSIINGASMTSTETSLDFVWGGDLGYQISNKIDIMTGLHVYELDERVVVPNIAMRLRF